MTELILILGFFVASFAAAFVIAKYYLGDDE